MYRVTKYPNTIVASESDRCRRFDRGLFRKILPPVIAIVKWTNFFQLVEATQRVEQSLEENKPDKEWRQAFSISGQKR